jgi:hypothetical protein
VGSGPGGYCVIAANQAESETSVQGPAIFEAADYDIDISNNTITTSQFTPNSGLFQGFGVTFGTSDYSGMVHVRNNIVPIGLQGFQAFADWNGHAGPQNGCGMEYMFGMYGGASNLHNNILTSDAPMGHTWQTFTTGTVNPACASAAGTTILWPVDHAGGFSWTSILDPTTFKVTNPAYNGWGTDKRDPGADIDLVNWRTAGAVSGAPNPGLDYAIQSVVPTSVSSLKIYFTAPDTTACTWELSTDGNLYTSSITVASQTRMGRAGIAAWNGLAAGTAYYARATCAGNKLETLINGTRAMAITAP